MLVPAVSPVPTLGPGASPRNQPIESRSFDSLLEEAGLTGADITPGNGAGADTQALSSDTGPEQVDGVSTLSQLSGIESIQNASLRQLIAAATERG
jgi:hypothetical protein